MDRLLTEDAGRASRERLTLVRVFEALRVAAVEAHAAQAEPFPFIADDLLVQFDDRRTDAALALLGRSGRTTQVILFTHHAHVVDMARRQATAAILTMPGHISRCECA
ncbi:hypothetical protein GXW76_00510 [Roseomonas soli]|uniref:Uncharacterized protein n=1 Tax=Neoroseomonas soli TaxID=1081025 RepID=A0A9X9WR59_9PROT|nr:hypothetical protein [Neoroseomonas soli]